MNIFTWVAKSGKEDAWTLSSVRGVLVLWWDGEEPSVSGSMLWALQCGTGEEKDEKWALGPGLAVAVCHFKSTLIIFTPTHVRTHNKKTHTHKIHLHHPQSVFSIQAAWERLTRLAFPHRSSSWLREECLGESLDWTDMFISGEWCPWMGPAAAWPFVTAERRPCELSN